MNSLAKWPISVDPRKEAGYVIEFGEDYDCLVDFYLAAGDEAALADSVVQFLVMHLLGQLKGRSLSLLFQQSGEVLAEVAA